MKTCLKCQRKAVSSDRKLCAVHMAELVADARTNALRLRKANWKGKKHE